MARGSFKPEKPAKNTEKQGVFNKAVSDLRPDTFDDSANDDAWAKKVVQRDWEHPYDADTNPDGPHD
jgi:hypothetical protein